MSPEEHHLSLVPEPTDEFRVEELAYKRLKALEDPKWRAKMLVPLGTIMAIFGLGVMLPDTLGGIVIGENVSETFEGEFLVLQVWLENALPRSVLFDVDATHLGFGWFQEENGKIWWVQVLGQLSEIS